ncbi:TrAP [Tomato yellow margin leaf curl virus]|uniref:Transcriptional activator protein n=1 Tax=Tomato yellow margin leaf curl virus TaxID=260909 RepID=Q6R7Q9_9GEMI|nr:TrAP [Tomato yellow margin leaf curl virus]AAR95976.1 TrAP [Tomato yellow margin leaf curl virus]
MQNSSSSTPPSIKPTHRLAKRRPRRKRIDLSCGCTIYVHLLCSNYGFTHRGNHHCSSGTEWRFYLGGAESPLFQDSTSGGPSVHNDQSVPHPNQVQPQPEEGIDSTQGLSELPSLDDISSSFWDDIFK